MPIIEADIKDVRPYAQGQLRLTLLGGKTVILDVQDWIDISPENHALQKPSEFMKGRISASGGIEWDQGPYLSLFKIVQIFNIQHSKPKGSI